MSNDVQISEREREILSLVATGSTNQQIAQQLNISPNTVKVHLRNIFAKIGVVSRTEATVYAIRSGLIAVELQSTAQLTQESLTLDGPLLEPPPHVATVVESDPVATLALPVNGDVTTELSEAPSASPRRRWPLVGIGIVIALVLLIGVTVLIRGERMGTTASPTAAITSPDGAASVAQTRWFTRATLPNPRNNFAIAGFDLEREIYVIGGRIGSVASAALDRYDPIGDRWVTLSDKPTAVSHIAATTIQGKIYVPGGENTSGQVLTKLEIYDPIERRWESGPPIPAPRSQYALVAWDGKLYLIGGWDGQQARSEVFIYDPETAVWSEGPALPSVRRNAGASIAGGRLYVFGGQGPDEGLRESIRLDPGSMNERRWISIAPLPQAIVRPATITTLRTISVFDPSSDQFWQYNQTDDAWQSIPLPGEAMVASAAVLLDTSIYFVAEATAPQPGAVAEYEAIYSILIPIR
jgi:DNA-binding CsgD family transcriptional regulator